MVKKLIPLTVQGGEYPSPDSTESAAPGYVQTINARMYRGIAQTLGGWDTVSFDDGATISGCPRRLYSQIIGTSSALYLMIGTHSNLYALSGTQLINVTPLSTTTTAIVNSLDNDYNTLGADPLDTTNTSTTVVVNQTAHRYEAGDTVTMSGFTATNGVPAGDINKDQIVRTVPDANSFTIIVDTAATSTGSGGGGTGVVASGIITVNQTAHGNTNGERIKLNAATAVGGVTAGQINIEHIVRNASTNEFDVVTAGTATSSVTGGGGAGTTIQVQLADGSCDPSFGQGYGMGRYGVGRYGVSKSSSNLLTLPRIYSFGRYGNNLIATPGDQQGVYSWDGDSTIAPAALTNAPTAVNYVFVSNNIVVTLGASGQPNRVKWSDQGDSTEWSTTDRTKLSGEDDIEGANEFISHVLVDGVNILFTDTQLYTMRFIGAPFVWEIREKDSKSGIIAREARILYEGVVYFMGTDNFYRYRGGRVESIPSTILQTVFGELNTTNQSKCFVWANEKFDEIWFHYPSGTSTECDKVAILDVQTGQMWRTNMERSAAEHPLKAIEFPRLVEDDGTLYRHENGNDDNGVAKTLTLKSNRIDLGDKIRDNIEIIPDAVQTGNYSLKIDGYLYPQSTTPISTVTKTVTFTTEKLDVTIPGRFLQLTLTQSTLGGFFRAGKFLLGVESGSGGER